MSDKLNLAHNRNSDFVEVNVVVPLKSSLYYTKNYLVNNLNLLWASTLLYIEVKWFSLSYLKLFALSNQLKVICSLRFSSN